MNKTVTEKPIAWLFPDIGMTTTHEDERDRWIAAGRSVLPLFTHPATSQPDVDALANFIRTIDGNHKLGAGALAEKICAWIDNAPSQPSAESLVAAALEAAAKVCDALAASLDNEWNRKLGVANDLSEVAVDLSIDIRALDKQKIIDGAGK